MLFPVVFLVEVGSEFTLERRKKSDGKNGEGKDKK
jgi:hypothetical protein